MSNPKPDFSTVIKTSISSITKHTRNISPNSKRNTNPLQENHEIETNF